MKDFENFGLHQPLSPVNTIEFIETIVDLKNTLDYYCYRLGSWADHYADKCNQMLCDDNDMRLDVRYLKKLISYTARRYAKGARMISIGSGITIPEPGVEDLADIDIDAHDRNAEWVAIEIRDIIYATNFNFKNSLGSMPMARSDKLRDAKQVRAGICEIHSGTLIFIHSCDVGRWIRGYWWEVEWHREHKKDKDV